MAPPKKTPDQYVQVAPNDAQTTEDKLNALIADCQNGNTTLPQLAVKLKDASKLLPAMVVHYAK